MPRIIVEARAARDMRYDTLGDWFTDSTGDTRVQVVGSDPLDDKTFLVALHELIEMKLCRSRGISERDVDEFDYDYEGDGEPGDHEDCPYRREHRFACLVEYLMAHELGLVGYGHVE